MSHPPAPANRRRVDVLCLTYGEPHDNVFRPQYEYSHSILNRLTRRVAPIPAFVTPLLAARRGRERVHKFNELGWNSPLEDFSRRQVQALQDQLDQEHPESEWRVRLVFEFRSPYLQEVLRDLESDAPDEIILLPLYVADSDFTSGVSRKDLGDYRASLARRRLTTNLPAPRHVEAFGFDPRSGAYMADFIWRQCLAAGRTEDELRRAVLILGAHGTLIFPPFGVNSGARETRYLFGQIRHHLKERFASVRIGWLNHKLGGTWTFPEVTDSARESQEKGIRRVVYFPFGFVADNGESQLEGKMQLDPFQWEDMLYLPCPNDDPAYIRLLASRVAERLAEAPADWATVSLGRPELERQERPAPPGIPAPFSFGSPVLAAVACLFWAGIGSLLLSRGIGYWNQMEPGLTKAFAAILGIALGCWKTQAIMWPMSKKNLLRIRRLPQPSPLYKMLSKASWIVVAFMMLLGLTLRIFPLPNGLRATILIAVGMALLAGAVGYIANWKYGIPLPGSGQPKLIPKEKSATA